MLICYRGAETLQYRARNMVVFKQDSISTKDKKKSRMVFLGKTYDVSPYDSQRSHPSMDLGVEWDLCVLFVQTAVNCQDCKFV